MPLSHVWLESLVLQKNEIVMCNCSVLSFFCLLEFV